MTDPRLVVAIVRPPKGVEFPEQIGLLITELGGAKPINRVRSRSFTDLLHLIADLIDRLIPADPLPFTAFELGWIFQAPLAMGVFTHRSALGTMGAEVERTIKTGLLADPDTILDFRQNRAAH